MSGTCAAPLGNAVKHFEAERREPSGESMTQTHRRARALPLQTQRFAGKKCFTALPVGAWAVMWSCSWGLAPGCHVVAPFGAESQVWFGEIIVGFTPVPPSEAAEGCWTTLSLQPTAGSSQPAYSRSSTSIRLLKSSVHSTLSPCGRIFCVRNLM